MQTMKIMQGVPGSGKSTFIGALVKEAIARGEKFTHVCSADHFFEKDGEYKFDPSGLGQAHAECKRKAVELIVSQKCDIIIDNTNTTTLEVAFYVDLAAAFGWACEIYTIACDDLEAAAKRNEHGVPFGAIQRMAQNIERFSMPAFWNVTRAKVHSAFTEQFGIVYSTGIMKR